MAYEPLEWHEGELSMHKLLKCPRQDNPSVPHLTPYGANIIPQCPLIAIGVVDTDGRPWTSLWGGEAGFTQPLSRQVVGLRTTIACVHDPVAAELFGVGDGEVVSDGPVKKMVSALSIDFESRSRVKLFGRMAAGSLESGEDGAGVVQLCLSIEQVLPNCPKYLNKRKIVPQTPRPELVSKTVPLPEEAVRLIEKSDLFFISSSHHAKDMDTNHRGGPPGFVRISSNTPENCTLVWPEYSGNRLYQTLGNLLTTPKAGLVFPDFESGNVLYVTGSAKVLTGENASMVLARCTVAVELRIEAVRFVRRSLAFRATPGEFSPYNPPVRHLHSEAGSKLARPGGKANEVKITSKEILTPTIARFGFLIKNPQNAPSWKAGQYVVLDFSREMDIGYSHMRDDDPTSLNDDFIRTFTISSEPGRLPNPDRFELTLRKAGVVTSRLFRHNPRVDFEMELRSFGGEFVVQQRDGEEIIGFVAAGVGITPLLARASQLDLSRTRLYWTIRAGDLGLVADTFARWPRLEAELFVTGEVDKEARRMVDELALRRVGIHLRRLCKADLVPGDGGSTGASRTPARWYLCTGTSLQRLVVDWLEDSGAQVLFEDFGY